MKIAKRSPVLEAVGTNLQMLVDYVPHSRALGLVVVDVRPGEAWLSVPYSADLVGDPRTGVLHGGVITALIDNCAGVAVMTALPALRSIATLDLRIDYMKPATPERDVIGHCRCYKVTRSIAFVHGTAYHDDPADPIATSAMTFMLGANEATPPIAATGKAR